MNSDDNNGKNDFEYSRSEPRDTGSGELRDNGSRAYHRPPENHRRHKWPAVVGIVLIVILASNMVIGTALYRFNIDGFTAAGDEIYGTLHFAESEISNLDVRLVNARVEISPHDGRDLLVEFIPPNIGRYNRPLYEIVGDRLVVAEPTAGRWGFFVFNFNIRSGTLAISVPRDADGFFDDFSVRNTNGVISCAAGSNHFANTARLNTTNGAITARDIYAGRIDISSTNGALNISNLSARTIEAGTTNGAIVAENVDVSRDLSLRTTNGAISLRDSQILDTLVARTTNGGITLSNVDADMDRADLSTTNGRVVIN